MRSKTVFKKYGIGFQVLRFHYLNGRFSSAYAPVTIGYKNGKFTFRLKTPKSVPR